MTVARPRPRVEGTRRWPSPTRGQLVREWAGVVAVVAVLLLLPNFTDQFFTGLVGRLLVFGLAAMSLDLVWGYAGQLSLGHAAFFGLGAYASGLVLAKTAWPAMGLVAVALGVATPAFLAFVMAAVLFYGRVAGAYFAIITLVMSLILERLAVSMIWLTGGINGLYGMEPLALGPLVVESPLSAYYFIVLACLGAYVLSRWLISSPFGRVVDAVRVNEPRAASLGYSTAGVKTIVFTLSGALAGLAGVLYVPLERFVYPSQLGIFFSTSIIVWLAIGGRRSLVGAFLGAFVVGYGQSLLSGGLEQYWVLATGVFLVLVVLTQPSGLVGVLRGARDVAVAVVDRRRARA